MLMLLDEAVSEGSFQITKACLDNDLPNITYSPHPDTAIAFFNSMTDTSDSLYIPESQISVRPKVNKQKTQKPIKSNVTKYTRDQLKRCGETHDLFDMTQTNKQDLEIDVNQGMDGHKAIQTITEKNPTQNYINDQDLNSFNPATHDDIPGDSIEPIEFTLLVKIATEMVANKQNTDSDSINIHGIVDLVKHKEQEINNYCIEGMTIEQAIDKATNIISGIPDCIQMHPSDFSDFNDNDLYDDLYDDSGMVYKSKQFSDICTDLYDRQLAQQQ